MVALKYFSLLIASIAFVQMAMVGDPDILTEFIAPLNIIIDGNFFTNTAFRALVGGGPPTAFKILKATIIEFLPLNGQSVSYTILEFPSKSTNPPHTHPRSAKLLFLIDGTLEVCFVDTKSTLFTQTLQVGDLFVFPKGLAHFQYNANPQVPTLAFSAFGSANAGTVSIPSTLLATSVDNNVLAISFKSDVATIQKLKAGLAP